MDWIVEILGSGGLLVTLTWLGKEILSGIIRRADVKRAKELEFKQYKQQASFDLKYKVYSEIYTSIKKLQGSIETFLNIEKFYEDYEDALFSRNNRKFFDAGNEKPEQYRSIYYSNRNTRVLININHFMGIIDEVHLELNNNASRNEFLFSDEEILSIKSILDQCKSTREKIQKAYLSTYSVLEISSESPPEKLDELMNEFMRVLEEKLSDFLDDDLDAIQNLIRNTDNLFRKEFETQ